MHAGLENAMTSIGDDDDSSFVATQRRREMEIARLRLLITVLDGDAFVDADETFETSTQVQLVPRSDFWLVTNKQ